MIIIDPLTKKPYVAEKSELLTLCGQNRRMYIEALKRIIIEQNRIDLFVTMILGLDLQPFHWHLLKFQMMNPNNLQLVFRGAGKSTIATEGTMTYNIVKYPDVRQVVLSKTLAQAQSRLKMVKLHLENPLLCEMFGEHYNHNLWNQREIQSALRVNPDATPTVVCVGAQGSIAGAHFDQEFADDFIDKTNSFTEVTREGTEEWYRSTFTPMLDPPDPDIPYRYVRNRVGTRYHHLDWYGARIKDNEQAVREGRKPPIAVNIIPAIGPTGQSPWPKRWPVKIFMERRKEIGHIAFSAQYLCTTDSMRGEIFNIDQFKPIWWHKHEAGSEDEETIESLLEDNKLDIFMGVDLAISEKETADFFSVSVVGKKGSGLSARYYPLEVIEERLPFHKQTNTILRLIDKWKVARCGVEVTGYQQAQYQELIRKRPEYANIIKPVRPKPGDDKTTRAHRLSTYFENGQVYFPERIITVRNGSEIEHEPETVHWKLRDQLILMPEPEHDDMFDSFEIAMQMANVYEKKTTSRDKSKLSNIGLIK